MSASGTKQVEDNCGKHGWKDNWCYTIDNKCGPKNSKNWKKCVPDITATKMVQELKDIEEANKKAKELQLESKTKTGLSKEDVENMISKATGSLKSQLKNSKDEIASLKSHSANEKRELSDQIASLKKEVATTSNSAANIVEQHISSLKNEIDTELKDAVADTNIKNQLIERQKHRLGKGGGTSIKSIGSIMRSKPQTNSKNATCTGGTPWTSDKLPGKKQVFCKGYKHLDLSSPEIKNIAIHYLNSDLSETLLNDNKHMSALATALRYDVQDTSCPSKLFDAKDISIQQVNMDTLGQEKEWVAIVNLNTQDTNGYLQSELPYCKARDYLIGAKAQVIAYLDGDGCCDGLKDYNHCKVTCKNKLVELKDKNHKHYAKDVVLTGTQYKVKSSYDVNRRRGLLQEHAGSGC
jgi:hypothetical protein